MSAISVRLAGAEDAETISSLCALHAAFEHAAFMSEEHGAKLAKILREPNLRIVIFLAEKAGVPIGYVALVREFSTWQAREFLHMDCLFVVEAMRGEGVGRQLFNAALDEAQRQGIDEIQWQTPDWNAVAIRFYQKLGAVGKAKQRFVIGGGVTVCKIP